MAEVAGRGEERRPSVLVAAVAGKLAEARLGLGQPRPIRGVERERKQPERVAAVLALAEPRADDDRGDRLLLEHPARGDVGHGDAVRSPTAFAAARTPCTLSHPPTASMNRLYLDLLQSEISAGSGRPTQRSLRNPPASTP